MPNYGKSDKFNKDKAFTRVWWGEGSKVLEVELTEVQKILNESISQLGRNLLNNGFITIPDITYSKGVLTVASFTSIIDGNLINITEPMTISVVDGDNIYLATWEQTITIDSTIHKDGNLSGGSIIVNDLLDSRIGEETSRRIQRVVQLVKDNSDTSKSYVSVASIETGGVLTVTAQKSKMPFETPVEIPFASLIKAGIVQLSNSIENDAEDQAATPKAVKIAYDRGSEGVALADEAIKTAAEAQSTANTAQNVANAANSAATTAQNTADTANTAAIAAQSKADQAFQSGNERKQQLVDALIAKGILASTSESWDALIAKVVALIRATGNASPAQVLAGYYFSNDAGNNVGLMPNRGNMTITPSRTNQNIPEGYHAGGGYVIGDANLIPENIKNGVKIYDTIGTAVGAVGNAVAEDVIYGKTFSNDTGTNLSGRLAYKTISRLVNGTSSSNITLTNLGWPAGAIIKYAVTVDAGNYCSMGHVNVGTAKHQNSTVYITGITDASVTIYNSISGLSRSVSVTVIGEIP